MYKTDNYPSFNFLAYLFNGLYLKEKVVIGCFIYNRMILCKLNGNLDWEFYPV